MSLAQLQRRPLSRRPVAEEVDRHKPTIDNIDHALSRAKTLPARRRVLGSLFQLFTVQRAARFSTIVNVVVNAEGEYEVVLDLVDGAYGEILEFNVLNQGPSGSSAEGEIEVVFGYGRPAESTTGIKIAIGGTLNRKLAPARVWARSSAGTPITTHATIEILSA
jgi:hypothetical protein